MSQGRTLELFFINGSPEGMLTAEVFNWNGHVLMTPRTQIGEALMRKEAGYTGVYLLIGEADGEPCAYIGEGENISDRIRNHDTQKDWWSTAVLIVSGGNSLNKAHVKFLEARLVEEARKAGRMRLKNGTVPSRPSLSEATQSNLEVFLDTLLMILPALRIDCFVKNTRPSVDLSANGMELQKPQAEFELTLLKEGRSAEAILKNGEFIVLKGSTASKDWKGPRPSNKSYWKLYERLVAEDILVDSGPYKIFKENYAFAGPRASESVVRGRSASGPSMWKVKNSEKGYQQWEAEMLETQSS
jgi:hypothetical protein